jgi:acetate---CoA ligase (ADP-forming)
VSPDADLEALFRPRSVAVVGASAVPGRVGNLIVGSLIDGGFHGPVYPVNRSGEPVAGLPPFASLADIPHPVDLAVLAVPAPAVPEAIGDCARRGVRAAIVLSSGFGEAGGAGAELERDVRHRAAAGRVRLLGPNCQGVLSLPDRLVANFSPAFRSGSTVGPVSMVSQSGGYTSVAYRFGAMNGVRFCRVVSTGNEADITANDVFEYLAGDPDTHVVAGYLEQIRDARRFLAVANSMMADKPVVISKGGRTDAGGRAASSHTGALAGAGAVSRGVLSQAGAQLACSVDEFVSLLTAFSGPNRLARGNRVALLSQGGGFSVETADLCRESGLELPPLQDATVKAICAMVPYYGTADNPVDFTAALMTNPGWLAEAVELAANDENVDVVALLLSSSPGHEAIRDLAQACVSTAKPVAIGWLADVDSSDRQELHRLGVPSFAGTGSLVTGITGLVRRGARVLGADFAGSVPRRQVRHDS